MINASLLPINSRSAQKEEVGGGGCVTGLHEILLKTHKSAGLANTLPNACKEYSNPAEFKKENIINNNKTFAAAVLAPSLFFCVGGDFV